MGPSWFAVLSIFHILRGFWRGLRPNFICRTKLSLMKQSVAPESTSAFVSAVILLVLIEMGMCMDRNRVVTITELNLWTALTQADGFRRSENPLFQRGPSSLILVRLLLRRPPPGAMCPLAAVEFECFLAPLLLALHHKHSCRRPPLPVLDFVVGSSFVGRCSIYSTYAGGNCDSNVPFCGKYNTQLRVGLVVFLPFGFLA